jgi:hypothetical protein
LMCSSGATWRRRHRCSAAANTRVSASEQTDTLAARRRARHCRTVAIRARHATHQGFFAQMGITATRRPLPSAAAHHIVNNTVHWSRSSRRSSMRSTRKTGARLARRRSQDGEGGRDRRRARLAPAPERAAVPDAGLIAKRIFDTLIALPRSDPG